MFEVEHIDGQTLCQPCYRTYLPALKLEEAVTKPWAIHAINEAYWSAQLLIRRTLYREGLATTL